MLRILECGLHIDALPTCGLETPLHQGAMRNDVEAPSREVSNLVLRLANDDLDVGFIQPGCLGRQLLSLLQERGMDDFVAHCLGLRSFLIRSRARLGASQAVRPS